MSLVFCDSKFRERVTESVWCLLITTTVCSWNPETESVLPPIGPLHQDHDAAKLKTK